MKNKSLTALITGASSGIGREFARQLSEYKYDTILVARRQEKLEEVAKNLQKNYTVVSEILPADLSTYEGIGKVEDYIRGVGNLDILVNSAGFGIPKRFQDVEEEKLLNMINLHVVAPTRLCYAVIPKMIRQEKGIIINVSSLASLIPKHKSTIYSATKSYLTMFSKTLQKDVGKRIKVQALCPGFTCTQFHYTNEFKNWDKDKIPKVLWMNVEDVVKSSLKALEKDKVVYIPGFNNRIFLSLMGNKLISSILWKYYEKTNKFKRED